MKLVLVQAVNPLEVDPNDDGVDLRIPGVKPSVDPNASVGCQSSKKQNVANGTTTLILASSKPLSGCYLRNSTSSSTNSISKKITRKLVTQKSSKSTFIGCVLDLLC